MFGPATLYRRSTRRSKPCINTSCRKLTVRYFVQTAAPTTDLTRLSAYSRRSPERAPPFYDGFLVGYGHLVNLPSCERSENGLDWCVVQVCDAAFISGCHLLDSSPPSFYFCLGLFHGVSDSLFASFLCSPFFASPASQSDLPVSPN